MLFKSLISCVLALSLSAPSYAQSGTDQKGQQWPQRHLDIPADPSVLFGQLPNGLRYAIKRNETPTEAVSLRLRIGSGSLVEHDNELGIAHFLEHMAFRGSAHFPDGELIRSMERLGLQFGADTNAFTSHTDTVFQFDLARNDQASLETGLKIFREIATKLRLDEKAIETERGVLLAEERASSKPEYEVWDKSQQFLLEGQIAGERDPIGTAQTISTISRDQLLAFYRTHYQPQNATVIVVGSIDPLQIESIIKQKFSDWPSDGIVPPFDPGAVKERGLTLKSLQHHGVTEKVEMSWVSPPDLRPRDRAFEANDVIRRAVLSVLNDRLSALTKEREASVLSASARTIDEFKAAEALMVSLEPVSGKLDEALSAAIRVLRSTVEFGISESEWQAEKSIWLASAEAAIKSKATRENASIAEDLTYYASSESVYTSPEYDLEQVKLAFDSTSLEQANKVLGQLVQGNGPLVFYSGPNIAPNDTATLQLRMQKLLAEPVQPYKVQATIPWPYASFGKAGQLTERRLDGELGVTFARFANGTQLAVKPTKYEHNSVSVTIDFGEGLFSLPPQKARNLWNWYLLVAGGTRKITYEQIPRSLAGRIVSLDFGTGPNAFSFSGVTTPEDLASQFQLFAAYYSDAAFRMDTFVAERDAMKQWITASKSDPQKVSDYGYDYLAHNRNARWRPYRDAAELDGTKALDLEMIMRPQMTGPVNISVVGDVSVDDTISAVAATFGALSTKPIAKKSNSPPRLPMVSARKEPYVFYHSGREDQAIQTLAWSTDWYFGMGRDTFSLTIAANILNARLTEIVRNELGLGYSPQVTLDVSTDYDDNGSFAVSLALPKDKFPMFRQIVLDEVRDMAMNGVTDDEFQRAKKPELEARYKRLETNLLWRSWLSGLLSEPPNTRTLIRNYIKGYEAVTMDEVRDVMRRRINGRVSLETNVVHNQLSTEGR